MPDVTGLRLLVSRIREQGNVEELIDTTTVDIENKQQELKQQALRQTVWTGSLEQLNSLQIPLRETLDSFDQRWKTAEKNLEQCDQDLATRKAELTVIQNELEKLELGGHVPIEAELQEARKHRDIGWTLVKKVWQDGLPEKAEEIRAFTGEAPLAMAFASAMDEADEVVDIMRRDSTTSADRSLLQLRQEQTLRAMEELRNKQAVIKTENDQLSGLWNLEWQPCKIQPKTPAEMKDWIANCYSSICQGLKELGNMEASLVVLNQKKQSAINGIYEAAATVQYQPPLKVDLKALLEGCDQYLQAIDEKKRTEKTLHEQIQMNQNKLNSKLLALEKKKSKLAEMEAEWSALRSRYTGLPEKVDDANIYVLKLKDLFSCVKESHEMQSDINNKLSACKTYEIKAKGLAASLAAPLGDSLSQWVNDVVVRLSAAGNESSKYQQIQERLDQNTEDIRVAQMELDESEPELQQMFDKFSCVDADSLGIMVERSVCCKKLKESCRLQEQAVRAAGDELPLDKLEAEASEVVDPDALATQLAQVKEELQKFPAELEKMINALADKRSNFNTLNGNDDTAAVQTQLAEQYLAEVDRYWIEYLRVEMARRLLDRTISDFREQNEDTVIKRASRFFHRLTLGRYNEIAVEYDNDIPYLEAIQADNGSLRVAQLSDGTRDQMFLSLRLAFVEKHLESSGPIPLIMDDILVNFDDQRTKATLEILHDLSEKTQILYFTHHQSVVDLAKGMESAGGVQLHNL